MEIVTTFIIIVAALISFVAGWFVSKKVGQGKLSNAQKLAEKIVADATKEAENIKKEKILEAKDQYYRLKTNFENESKNKRNDLNKLEQRLSSKSIELDKRHELIAKKENEIKSIDDRIKSREVKVTRLEAELENLIAEQNRKLEKINSISHEEAKQLLMKNLEDKAKQEAAQITKEIKDKARQTANREAKEIIIQAIQRTAADHSTETTVSVVNLPTDEMKFRIIGLECRN